MASSKPSCSAGRPVAADGRADAVPAPAGVLLPPDAVYEILLRLPAKELCRLRAVCRPWRALLSDRAFADAHAARHQEPLVVAGYATHTSGGALYDVLDLSGRVVKRARGAAVAGAGRTENEWVVSARLDLVCVARGAGVSCALLSPAAARARALPQGLAEEHAAHEREISHHAAMVALGQVAATGERKVLRVLHLFPGTARQLYEITTLDGGGGGRSRWRRIKDPACPVASGTWAVVDGAVFFFSSELVHGQDAMPDRVASFDLATEEWAPTIRGPLSSSSLGDDGAAAAAVHPDDHMGWGELSLADMNGCLVVTHRTVASSMDLWFLMDVEKGSWVRKYRMQLSISYRHAEHTVRPLLVLNDGRIVLVHIGNRGSLKIYDPRTSTSTDVAEIGPCVAVGLYNGSVLNLANGAN